MTTQHVLDMLDGGQFADFYDKYFLKINVNSLTELEKQKYNITNNEISKYNSLLNQNPKNLDSLIKSGLNSLNSESGLALLSLVIQKADATLLAFAPNMMKTFESNVADLNNVNNSSIDYYITYYNCLKDHQKQVILNDQNYNFNNDADVIHTLEFVKEQADYFKEKNNGQNFDKTLVSLWMKEIRKTNSQSDLNNMNDLYSYMKNGKPYAAMLLNEDPVYGFYVNKTFKYAGDLYDFYYYKDAYRLNNSYSDFTNGARAYFDNALSEINSFKKALNQGEQVCDNMQEFYQFFDELQKLNNANPNLQNYFIGEKYSFVAYFAMKALNSTKDNLFEEINPSKDLNQWFGNVDADSARAEMNQVVDFVENFEKDPGKIAYDMVYNGLYNNDIKLYLKANYLICNIPNDELGESAKKYFGDLGTPNSNQLANKVCDLIWFKYLELGGSPNLNSQVQNINLASEMQAIVTPNLQAGGIVFHDETLLAPTIEIAQRMEGNKYLLELNNIGGAQEIEYNINGVNGKISIEDYLELGGILVDFDSQGNYAFTARTITEKDGRKIASGYSTPQRGTIQECNKAYFEALESNIISFMEREKKINVEIINVSYNNDMFKISVLENGVDKHYGIDLSKDEINRSAKSLNDLAFASTALISAVGNGAKFKELNLDEIENTEQISDTDYVYSHHWRKFENSALIQQDQVKAVVRVMLEDSSIKKKSNI